MSILFSQNLLKNNEILPQEAEFTEVLNSIAVKPKILYLYGSLPENRLKLGCKKLKIRPKSIAIVGSRKPTKYGENIAYRLAYEAARRGAVVVSGLAYGIDSVAHRAGRGDCGGTRYTNRPNLSPPASAPGGRDYRKRWLRIERTAARGQLLS